MCVSSWGSLKEGWEVAQNPLFQETGVFYLSSDHEVWQKVL